MHAIKLKDHEKLEEKLFINVKSTSLNRFIVFFRNSFRCSHMCVFYLNKYLKFTQHILKADKMTRPMMGGDQYKAEQNQLLFRNLNWDTQIPDDFVSLSMVGFSLRLPVIRLSTLVHVLHQF